MSENNGMFYAFECGFFLIGCLVDVDLTGFQSSIKSF